MYGSLSEYQQRAETATQGPGLQFPACVRVDLSRHDGDFEVDSTEQRMKDVEAAGGAIVFGPHTIEEMGIYAQVVDTEGNIIGLWQSLKAQG